MSDSEHSTVSYTSISSDSDPSAWGIPLMDADEISEMDSYEEDEEESFEDDDDEKKEHLAPADSTAVASPVVDPVSSAKETELFETDEFATTPPPPPVYRTTARMSIRAQAPIPFLVAGIRLRAASPLPLPAPSTSRRADIPEANIPPRKRFLLTAPTPRFEVGESFAAAATRQSGSTVARGVDYSFVDIMNASVRASERRTMVSIEMVNLRVSYQAQVHRRESEESYTRHQDAQRDHAALRVEVDTLRRYLSSLCTTHEQERVEARQALARSEAHNRALEARIVVLETQAHHHEWQHQDADDRATGHIMRIQALKDGARVDTLEDTASIVVGLVYSFTYRTIMYVFQKMPLRRGTRIRIRTTPVTATATTTATATATATTLMTDVAIRALIAQGVADALAGRPI
ncbi:hypothetical protein Tco_0938877 [Tanacetum coccineum]|uniref:Uncharacterized protein n=1 Tax=Tanacetum coccineum TaxID=301880 RepID=A0ABQ5DJ28_9ASTR